MGNEVPKGGKRMAKPDFICRDCYWRVDNQSKVKCRREVKQKLVCNVKSMYRMVSARSSGSLSKDGLKCKYFDKR
jgi:hypothetical protein